MISYVYVLALLFFTITNSQVIYWTGGAGPSNNTLSDPNNWSTGQAPTETSIVHINDTTCNGCTIRVDIDITVAELYLGAVTRDGPILVLEGATLTVTGVLTIGTLGATTYYDAYIYINKGSTLVFDTDSVVTIYYGGSNSVIGSTEGTEDNWLINKGTVTILGNTGATVGNDLYIGYSTDYPLYVQNWGNWDASKLQVTLVFYEIISFEVYGGDFNGGYITDTEQAIQWRDTNVIFQQGSGVAPTKRAVGPVTFQGAVQFYSTISQGFDDYEIPPPYSVVFNTTGVTVNNAHFYATNIVFLYDGWLMDCNITNYALINSSSEVSGKGVHAYIKGTQNYLNYAVFAGVNTDFIIQVEETAVITMNSYFALTGSITLINNGNWIYSSGGELYFDVAATWVNLGLMEVITSSVDYIKGTQFPGLTAYTEVGKMVNMGTIEFKQSGGLNFQQESGEFYQCQHGILKFTYDDDGYPGTVTLPEVFLNGYIGIHFSGTQKFPSSGVQTLFSWAIPADSTPAGSVSVISNTGIIDLLDGLLLCYSKDNTGGATVNSVPLTDLVGGCPSGYTQFLEDALNTDVCSKLDTKITDLADSASCPAKAGCGSDTGTVSDGPSPGSDANVNAASLAFLISLVCLFLNF